jgi:hypothetical protein
VVTAFRDERRKNEEAVNGREEEQNQRRRDERRRQRGKVTERKRKLTGYPLSVAARMFA